MEEIKDTVIGKGIVTVEKYRAGEKEPYETITAPNTWLTTGWTELLKLITGASASHFSNGTTQIGVGDSSTAADAAQTDLLAATNKVYVSVISGYPTIPSAGTVQYRAQFLTSQANFAWNELVIKNSGTNICWNRAVASWGTK